MLWTTGLSKLIGNSSIAKCWWCFGSTATVSLAGLGCSAVEIGSCRVKFTMVEAARTAIVKQIMTVIAVTITGPESLGKWCLTEAIFVGIS